MPVMAEREPLLRLLEMDQPCFSWDTYCDLLDGVPWDILAPRLPHFNQTGQSSHGAARLREQFAGPGQYFHETNSSRFAHEVFWLKLMLFDRLCRQVAAIQRDTRRPVLTLDPAHILITVPEPDHGYVPVRWGCRLTIRTAEAETRPVVDDMPAEMANNLYKVSQDVDPQYVRPSVRAWPFGCEVAATALIQSADPIPDEGETSVRALVRVHVIADGVAAQTFSPQDVFRLALPLKKKGAEVRIWARIVDAPERGIVLSGVTDALSPEVWSVFQEASTHAVSDARAAIYRSVPASCDLYGLGMLLLRALLGSDSRRWEQVIAALPALLDGMAPVIQGVEPSDYSVVHVRIRERLCEWQDLFIGPGIASDLWWDALTLGLRALSTVPGFGYSNPLSQDAGSSNPRSIDLMLSDVEHLARRTRVELFEAEERDRAIQTACNRVLADLGIG